MKKWLLLLLCALCLPSAVAEDYMLPVVATCCPYIIEEVHYGYDSRGELVVKGLNSINYLNYMDNIYGVDLCATRIMTEIDGQPVTRVQSKYFGHFAFTGFDWDVYNNAGIVFIGEGDTLPVVDLSEWGERISWSDAKVVLPAAITSLDLEGRDSFFVRCGLY